MAKLLALFIIVPSVELFLLIRLGAHLGALLTVLVIIFTGALGAYLARLQGLTVLYQAQQQINVGKIPAGSLVDGVLILIAGALLMTPGIITDGVGLMFLVPYMRTQFKGAMKSWFLKAVNDKRVDVHVSGVNFNPQGGPVVDVQPRKFDDDLSG